MVCVRQCRCEDRCNDVTTGKFCESCCECVARCLRGTWYKYVEWRECGVHIDPPPPLCPLHSDYFLISCVEICWDSFNRWYLLVFGNLAIRIQLFQESTDHVNSDGTIVHGQDCHWGISYASEAELYWEVQATGGQAFCANPEFTLSFGSVTSSTGAVISPAHIITLSRYDKVTVPLIANDDPPPQMEPLCGICRCAHPVICVREVTSSGQHLIPYSCEWDGFTGWDCHNGRRFKIQRSPAPSNTCRIGAYLTPEGGGVEQFLGENGIGTDCDFINVGIQAEFGSLYIITPWDCSCHEFVPNAANCCVQLMSCGVCAVQPDSWGPWQADVEAVIPLLISGMLGNPSCLGSTFEILNFGFLLEASMSYSYAFFGGVGVPVGLTLTVSGTLVLYHGPETGYPPGSPGFGQHQFVGWNVTYRCAMLVNGCEIDSCPDGKTLTFVGSSADGLVVAPTVAVIIFPQGSVP